MSWGDWLARAHIHRNSMTFIVFFTALAWHFTLAWHKSMTVLQIGVEVPRESFCGLEKNLSCFSVFQVFVYYCNTLYHDNKTFSPNLSWIKLYEFSCQPATFCLGWPAIQPGLASHSARPQASQEEEDSREVFSSYKHDKHSPCHAKMTSNCTP